MTMVWRLQRRLSDHLGNRLENYVYLYCIRFGPHLLCVCMYLHVVLCGNVWMYTLLFALYSSIFHDFLSFSVHSPRTLLLVIVIICHRHNDNNSNTNNNKIAQLKWSTKATSGKINLNKMQISQANKQMRQSFSSLLKQANAVTAI